jgi:hypothetical protein
MLKKIRINGAMLLLIMHAGCRSANILAETPTSQNHRADQNANKQALI